MDGYIGQVLMFAGNFAPRNWALCDGQLLPIASNQALFSIIGTNYGGDGRTSFALPDLRGRVPLPPGNGPGLSHRTLGGKGGTETNMLNKNQMPAHSHTATAKAKAFNAAGNAATPVNNSWSVDAGGTSISYSDQAPNADMNAATVEVQIQNEGNSQPIDNMQPYLGVNYIICLEGLYPSRS